MASGLAGLSPGLCGSGAGQPWVAGLGWPALSRTVIRAGSTGSLGGAEELSEFPRRPRGQGAVLGLRTPNLGSVVKGQAGHTQTSVCPLRSVLSTPVEWKLALAGTIST